MNKIRRSPSATWALVGAGLLLLALAVAAQTAGKRTILGQVLDENDKAVATAIVHLKNTTTKEELTMVTNKEGRYQFVDLPVKNDYELYAERGEQKSPTRKVSQFDSRERIVVNLKLQPPEKTPPKAEQKD